MLGNILILNLYGVLDQHSLQYLSSVGAACDCGAAAESFEDSFVDFSGFFVDLYLQLHYVTTSWSSD